MMDLMIDIETMGNGPNAVMIQLAGVYFDPLTGEIGDEFCMSLDKDECLELGFKTDISTIGWWTNQNQDVLHQILKDKEPVEEVMNAFADFIKPLIPKGRIWSHATFDFVIVQEYLKKMTNVYMPYKGAMDIRTLTYLSGINLDEYDWSNKTHNALDDCRFQIKYCSDAIKMIADNKEKVRMYEDLQK